jgi:hypothetical protein
MLDLDHPNWLPFNDPVNQLVHTEDGTAVASVMIGGRLVIDNRRVVTVDLGRPRASVSPPPMPTTAVFMKPSNRSSAAIAQVWLAPPTTFTVTARGWI